MPRIKSKIMDSRAIDQALTRIAHEILERNKDTSSLALVGLRTQGVYLAQRLAAKIKELNGAELKVGIMDITLYRDDVRGGILVPQVKETLIDFDLDGKKVVLVDDVLFTGRSIRCALDQLIDFGRPKEIQLAVLIDRGHRELPIRADYVGKNIPTAAGEQVVVRLKEGGGPDEVVIEEED
ncbi:MAG: bifunctional pyr operon transcriptional regulator/uracil phosphoribosyltransferase PyrR [Candidatus Omnitrophica bacterium]|nr:bifunctional pyr operon transcriptional regulator/uracil phosphoribosyltransferase PyrR [Candidatus Omnitrophota bacterium]